MLKLYGHPLSTCTQRVIVTLKEKGLPYELVPVNVTKQEDKERLVREGLNPFGQIPVLVEEDGHQVYESRAIARYIALKYALQGTPLHPDPSDLKAVSKFETAANVEAFSYTAFASTASFELVMKKIAGGVPDEARGQAALAQLRAKLKVYDGILSKQRFVAGDSLTIVDLFHLPDGETLTSILKSDVLTSEETPNVARWWREISGLASWREVVADAATARKAFVASH